MEGGKEVKSFSTHVGERGVARCKWRPMGKAVTTTTEGERVSSQDSLSGRTSRILFIKRGRSRNQRHQIGFVKGYLFRWTKEALGGGKKFLE